MFQLNGLYPLNIWAPNLIRVRFLVFCNIQYLDKGGISMSKARWMPSFDQIMDILSEYVDCAWSNKEQFKNGIDELEHQYALVPKTGIKYCQCCTVDFKSGDIVYAAPLDNSILCHRCAAVHDDKEPRVVR